MSIAKDKALKLAIESMKHSEKLGSWCYLSDTIDACQSALAEPLPQSSEAFLVTSKLGHRCGFKSTSTKKGDYVYASPQPSPNVDELVKEIASLKENMCVYAREELSYMDYESDQDVLDYFATFNNKNY
jgi:hypothetical protein